MTLLRRIVVLGLLLCAAAPQAWSQTQALNGSPLVLYGLTFTLGTCKINNVACTSAQMSALELTNVPAGRGNIEIELIPTSGSSVLALTPVTGNSTQNLTFTLTVSQTPGKPTTTVNSASLATTGKRQFTCNVSPSSTCTNGTTAMTTVSFSSALSPLSQSYTGASSSSLLTPGFTAVNHGSPANPFTITESLSLAALTSGDYKNTFALQFNSTAILLRAAPEPASIMVFLSAIGGIAAVRRRRKS
jgi:hypothetical protein